jgi:hypothetical protein
MLHFLKREMYFFYIYLFHINSAVLSRLVGTLRVFVGICSLHAVDKYNFTEKGSILSQQCFRKRTSLDATFVRKKKLPESKEIGLYL